MIYGNETDGNLASAAETIYLQELERGHHQAEVMNHSFIPGKWTVKTSGLRDMGGRLPIFKTTHVFSESYNYSTGLHSIEDFRDAAVTWVSSNISLIHFFFLKSSKESATKFLESRNSFNEFRLDTKNSKINGGSKRISPLNRSPTLPVLLARSDPAKSTKWNLLYLKCCGAANTKQFSRFFIITFSNLFYSFDTKIMKGLWCNKYDHSSKRIRIYNEYPPFLEE